jgi:hypothetical protein
MLRSFPPADPARGESSLRRLATSEASASRAQSCHAALIGPALVGTLARTTTPKGVMSLGVVPDLAA